MRALLAAALRGTSAVCANETVTYEHRVDDPGTCPPPRRPAECAAARTGARAPRTGGCVPPGAGMRRLCRADNYNWCTVPGSGYDAILFAAIAVVFACLLQGQFSALYVLIAGRLL